MHSPRRPENPLRSLKVLRLRFSRPAEESKSLDSAIRSNEALLVLLQLGLHAIAKGENL